MTRLLRAVHRDVARAAGVLATRTLTGGGAHERVHSDVLVFAQPHDHADGPGDLSRPSAPDVQP